MICKTLTQQFSRDGYVIIPGFYNYERQILPILEGIRQIIAAVSKKYNISLSEHSIEYTMNTGFMELIKHNRKWGGEVYDAVKQIPAFMGLVSDARNASIFSQLRAGALPGLAAGGYGIRIDVPSEEKYRAPWHQEFPAQLRSIDGVVFWSPLVPIYSDLGPVEICVGSHNEGLVPVYRDDGGIGKAGAYALRLDQENNRIARYEHVSPLSSPGDLILMDFLTLHQSGLNKAKFPRWSMQFRYFNFNDPIGIKIGWKGSFADGVEFSELFPEMEVSK